MVVGVSEAFLPQSRLGLLSWLLRPSIWAAGSPWLVLRAAPSLPPSPLAPTQAAWAGRLYLAFLLAKAEGGSAGGLA